MPLPSFSSQIVTAPIARDSEALRHAMARWRRDGPDDPDSVRQSDDPLNHAPFRTLLEGVFAGSPYLSKLAFRERDLVHDLLNADPDDIFEREIARLTEPVAPPETGRRAVTERLRRVKRRMALLIALADLGGVRPLDWVTNRLSCFAAAALDAALAHLLTDSAARGEIALAEPERPLRDCGIAILAMGKMGAYELNYSSDIDLIVIYQPESMTATGRLGLPDLMTRMTRALIELMQERTGDGYVFRTDLRLRPDPTVTPLAVSFDAAIAYYETFAQNWERAAMIKARAAAGDIGFGEDFLDAISPFVWRKSLDFAAIADIQSIKRQIHASKGHRKVTVAGHDIKVGRGGIREIEFFVQTQQLIAGGRDPRLRRSGTLAAMDALAETGRIADSVADDMKQAYGFLRRVEHRLQMQADAQTQKLPRDAEALDSLAAFAGYQSREGFDADLLAHMSRVADHYADLFADAPSLAADHGNLVFTGPHEDPGTIETLEKMGFESPAGVIGSVKAWHTGRYRATRTERAKQMLTDLVPVILKAVSETSSPDNALSNFDRFLSGLPAGVQFMALLHANPDLIDLLARILGTAPALAEMLTHNVGLLDALLEPDQSPAHDREELVALCERQLSVAGDHEGVLNAVRRFANDRRFEIGVGLLTGQIDFDRAGRALSDIAGTVLRGLRPYVEAEVVRRHGRLADTGMAVIAMGRLGGGEMTFGSDLDLIFVYDDDGDDGGGRRSDGAAPLQTGPYFTRLSQRYISAITALTAEGRLYDVDMRLRPSGNKGPVAVPFSAYVAYMENDAWTWEIMAATRARVIDGPPALAQRVAKTLTALIGRRREPEELRQAVLEMRGRLAAHHKVSEIWSLKHIRGGLVDLEFLIQFLTLAHARAHPDIVLGHTADALTGLHGAGLLTAADFARLSKAHDILNGAQMLLRLCYSNRFDADAAAPDFRRLIAGALDVASYEEAAAAIRQAEADVLQCFEQIVGVAGQ